MSDENIDSVMLHHYYKRLFPHQQFYRWISYDEPSVFSRREFSFTMENDVYIRYQSFENQIELEKEICNRNPCKIDIGAVMSSRPSQRLKSMEPVQKELVFDIDMTDYDDVRTCCSNAAVCVKCWKYMSVACKILDETLREDFGFEHILWVFSGRRGIHGWISDEIARNLDVRGRTAVAEYLQLCSGKNVSNNGDGNIEKWFKINLNGNLHQVIKRALRIIEPIFEEICCVDQNLFGNEIGVIKLLDMIPDNGIRKELEAKLNPVCENNSTHVWNTVKSYFDVIRSTNWRLKYIIEEIQLSFIYPRLDINVTKGFNHLLKSPFCIHPRTGQVCVPFNPGAVDKFDTNNVPKLNQLFKDIDSFDKETNKDDERSNVKDFKKTGLFKAVNIFEEFVRKLELSLKEKNKSVNVFKMEF